MSSQGIFCPRNKPGRFGRVLPFFLLLSATLFPLVGVALLVRLELRGGVSAVQSSFACAMLLMGALQGRIAFDVRRQARRNKQPPRIRIMTFARWMLVGTLLSYAAALTWHPRPDAGWLFALGVALWYTLAWLPLAEHARVQAAYRCLLTTRGVRNVARATCGLLLLACTAEVGLRGYGILFGQSPRAISCVKMAQGAKESLPATNHSAAFQVAAIGGQSLSVQSASRHVLEQLEQLLPMTSVRQFGGLDGNRGAAGMGLANEIITARPDLVLWFVSPDEELSSEEPAGDLFDSRNLHLAKIASEYFGSPEKSPHMPHADSTEATRQSHLSSCERRLIACRTPLDDAMRGRWEKLESEIETVALACRQREIPLAIVLVPGDFQINRELSDAARRRLGWEERQVDLELPQRRLAAFAAQEKLAVYDLLPCLSQAEESPYVRHSSEWNELGHEIAAASLGRWINARYGTMIASASQAKNPR